MSSYITREEFLAPRPRRHTTLTIPDEFEELAGKKLRVQAMSAKERGDYERSLNNPKTGEQDPKLLAQARERMAMLCVVDEAGNRLFTRGDIQALNKADSKLLCMIFDAALKLSSGDEGDFELGNSEPTTGEDSACA